MKSKKHQLPMRPGRIFSVIETDLDRTIKEIAQEQLNKARKQK